MAITEGAVIVVNGGTGSSATYTSSSFDSTGGGGILYFLVHEGASTTYTWSDNKSTAGANFVLLATINGTVGAGSGDISLTGIFVHNPTVGTGHTLTCTLGAARPFRFGGGVVLNGTFSSTFLSATVQSAQNGTSDLTVDAGSLVTDAAAYCIQYSANYNAATATVGSGWTLRSNATAGRHFQIRNEAASGTFDPVHTISDDGLTWLTIAAAIKETAAAGGGAPRYAGHLIRLMGS